MDKNTPSLNCIGHSYYIIYWSPYFSRLFAFGGLALSRVIKLNQSAQSRDGGLLPLLFLWNFPYDRHGLHNRAFSFLQAGAHTKLDFFRCMHAWRMLLASATTRPIQGACIHPQVFNKSSPSIFQLSSSRQKHDFRVYEVAREFKFMACGHNRPIFFPISIIIFTCFANTQVVV